MKSITFPAIGKGTNINRDNKTIYVSTPKTQTQLLTEAFKLLTKNKRAN